MIPVRPDPLTDPLPGGHLRYAYAAASVPAATGRTIRRWSRGLVHESHLRHAAALVLCYGVNWPLPAVLRLLCLLADLLVEFLHGLGEGP